ncbi:MAG: Ig-like domain-containing protein [Myxococcales bacterium]|nr:Ig-like domain-containing protein [Myxococcales bacterium]
MAVLLISGGLVACDSDGGGGGAATVDAAVGGPGGAGGGGGGAGGEPGVAVSGLTFRGFDDGELAIGEEQRATVEAAFADGTSRDVTAEATWTSSNPDVASVSAGVITAVGVGTATITVELQQARASIDLTVVEAAPSLMAIDISPEAPRLALEGEEQFKATARYTDGSTADVTDQVEWTVDDDRVLGIDEGSPGLVEVLAGGPVTLRAALGDVAGEVSTTVRCGAYPRYVDVVRFRGVMPPVGWDRAYNRFGEPMSFHLDDMRCFADYADKDTLVVIFGAGWCPACTLYTRLVDRVRDRLERAGMEILHITMQNAEFGPASSAYANSHITHLIGDHHGIRVGDRDSLIERDAEPNYLTNLDFLEVFPTVLVVRKADMTIIADSRDKRLYLPLEEIALAPNADWRDPDAVEVINHCGEGDEEEWEGDNNYPGTAPDVGVGTYAGGICDGDADFYHVDIAGPWRATLTFSNEVGDLGMYLWSQRTNQPLTNARGEVIGSDGVGDVETFTHQGPADLLIEGFMRRQTAPYTLTIEAL